MKLPIDNKAAKKVHVVYDKACPVCNVYCQLTEKHADAIALTLIDARQSSELMSEITKLGLDIDEGMVVEADGKIHYGADAIHMLASIAEPTNLFNRTARLFFGNRNAARFLYPFLRTFRNFLLKILRVSRINNLEVPGNEKF